MKTKIILMSLLFTGAFHASAQTDVTFGPVNTLGSYSPADISGECNGIYSVQLDDGDTGFRGGEAASVWCNSHTLDLNRSFEMEFDIRFGNVSAADGITFTMQNESSTALKGGGGWLGVTSDWSGTTGITNSVTVEFDIFNNGVGNADISQDHCAISYNGALNAPVVGPAAITLNDNTWEHVRISWDACETTLTVDLNGDIVALLNADLVNDVFGGISTGIFFGFTSATWSQNTTHDLCFKSYKAFDCCENIPLPELELFSPAIWEADRGCCVGVNITNLPDANASVIYDWGDGTTSYENTHCYDAGGVYDITVIVQYHLLDDPMNCCIKRNTVGIEMDCDKIWEAGEERKESDESFSNRNVTSELFPNPIKGGEELTLRLTESPASPVNFSIINMSGQKVMDFQSNKSEMVRVTLPAEMSDGLYMIVPDNRTIEPVKFQVKN